MSTDPTAGTTGQAAPKIVIGEYDDATAQHDALVRENARLRQERNEAREVLGAETAKRKRLGMALSHLRTDMSLLADKVRDAVAASSPLLSATETAPQTVPGVTGHTEARPWRVLDDKGREILRITAPRPGAWRSPNMVAEITATSYSDGGCTHITAVDADDAHGLAATLLRLAGHTETPQAAPPCGHPSGIHDEHCDAINDYETPQAADGDLDGRAAPDALDSVQLYVTDDDAKDDIAAMLRQRLAAPPVLAPNGTVLLADDERTWVVSWWWPVPGRAIPEVRLIPAGDETPPQTPPASTVDDEQAPLDTWVCSADGNKACPRSTPNCAPDCARPPSPVSGGGEAPEGGDFDYAMTPARHAQRIQGMGDAYRAASWWSFAEATDAELRRVCRERDQLIGAVAIAEKREEDRRDERDRAFRDREIAEARVRDLEQQLAGTQRNRDAIGASLDRLYGGVERVADQLDRVPPPPMAGNGIAEPVVSPARVAAALRSLLSPPGPETPEETKGDRHG